MDPSFISYSGGVESTAMLALFGHIAIPLFADTGWEHDAMYQRLEEVERLTGRTIVRVRRPDIDLPGYIRRQKFAPSPRARYCTRMFKVEPIDDYLAVHAPCELMIGLNADEAGLRVGNLGKTSGVRYIYPLIDLGLTRSHCIALLKERELMPNFPDYMRRGGCKGCFFKSKREFYRMARESPQESDCVAELEDAIQDERGRRYGIRDGIKSLRAFNAAARRDGVLDFSPGDGAESIGGGEVGSPCGLFCHR